MKYIFVTIENGVFVTNFTVSDSNGKIEFTDVLRDDYVVPILRRNGTFHRGVFYSLDNPGEFMEAFIKSYSSSYCLFFKVKEEKPEIDQKKLK